MKNRIVRLDLAKRYRLRKEEYDVRIGRALASGRYLAGQQVDILEARFASLHHAPAGYAIAVASGTAALALALRTLTLAGKKVLVPDLAPTAVGAAVELSGHVPVLIESYEDTGLPDTDMMQEQLEIGNVSAMVVIHLFGCQADMRPYRALANEYDVLFVEDCSHLNRVGLETQCSAGGWGDVAVFSCYPTKPLAALGDAGLVLVAEKRYAQLIRAGREYGWEQRTDKRSMLAHFGNSRMDEIQAAALRVALDHLAVDNSLRWIWSEHYARVLTEMCELRLWPGVYQVVVAPRNLGNESWRPWIIEGLRDSGIAAQPAIPYTLWEQPGIMHSAWSLRPLPIAHSLARNMVALPVYPEMDSDDVHYVCEVLATMLHE